VSGLPPSEVRAESALKGLSCRALVDEIVYIVVDILAVSTTIRVTEHTRDRLAALARSTGRPMTDVVDDAVDALERRVFFDRLSTRFSELRADSSAWAEVEAERAIEAGAAGDRSA
jgi:hypothetical protein